MQDVDPDNWCWRGRELRAVERFALSGSRSSARRSLSLCCNPLSCERGCFCFSTVHSHTFRTLGCTLQLRSLCTQCASLLMQVPCNYCGFAGQSPFSLSLRRCDCGLNSISGACLVLRPSALGGDLLSSLRVCESSFHTRPRTRSRVDAAAINLYSRRIN